MTDEIFRNILTSGTPKRRMRFYCASLTFPGSFVGQESTAQISFERGRHYLCTGIQSVFVNDSTARNDSLPGIEYLLSRTNSAKKYSRVDQVQSSFTRSFAIGDELPGGEYLYFDGNDNLQIHGVIGPLGANSGTVYFTLAGIEYIPAGA